MSEAALADLLVPCVTCGRVHTHADVAKNGKAVAALSRAVETLTPAEGEVFSQMAFGSTNMQLAERLFVTNSAVKAHLRAIRKKLGGLTRAQIVFARPVW